MSVRTPGAAQRVLNQPGLHRKMTSQKQASKQNHKKVLKSPCEQSTRGDRPQSTVIALKSRRKKALFSRKQYLVYELKQLIHLGDSLQKYWSLFMITLTDWLIFANSTKLLTRKEIKPIRDFSSLSYASKIWFGKKYFKEEVANIRVQLSTQQTIVCKFLDGLYFKE